MDEESGMMIRFQVGHSPGIYLFDLTDPIDSIQVQNRLVVERQQKADEDKNTNALLIRLILCLRNTYRILASTTSTGQTQVTLPLLD
jgi:hypothetical protein